MTAAAGLSNAYKAHSDLQILSPSLNGDVLRRAALVALILGSALTLTNQPGAIFGSENIRLLPLLLVYLTPFVVVSISQMLGAQRAAADARRGKACELGVETFASTAFSHGIPSRAAQVGFVVAGVNTAIVLTTSFLEQGNLNALPLPLLGQAFALPVLFGALSQAIAYRRAITALCREAVR